ncbi:hypothetical protein VBD025_15845 [Virgibacillus flavescens]|uniref:hypothetical protein n=1 Tax=Virgibacillus flavescens TaxID=1611422 RepID=UPI003D34BFCD
MPKLNRIRISNIKLDGGNKVFGDKIFNVMGNNALFLLENGGGKTSLIQLIHQVILPNHTIQGREMKKNVQKGQTIHVATEWIQDDEFRDHFVTGFCFENYGVKRYKDDPGYEYFNYVNEYDHQNAIRLEDLPFSMEGRVTNLKMLKEFLRKQKGVQVAYKNKKQYQESLEQYGLMGSEWKNISKINSEEGGIKAFFEKVLTTETLLERLFVPFLEENLFPNEQEKNAISNAFQTYKEKLLSLPEQEKKLKDYQVILGSADSIIDACEVYNNIRTDLEIAQKMLGRVYVTIKNRIEDNNELLKEVKEKIVQIESEIKHVNWKIKSYEAHAFKIQLLKAEEEWNEAEEQVRKLTKDKDYLERSIKEQQAAQKYGYYQDVLENAYEARAEIESAKLEGGERLIKLQEEKEIVSKQYRHLKVKQEKELDSLENHFTSINLELTEAKDNKELKQQELMAISETRKELSVYIQNYEKELIELQKNHAEVWDKDALHTENTLQRELKKVQFEKEQLEIKEQKDWERFSCLKNQEQEIKTKTLSEKNQLSEREKEFDTFSELENSLKDKVDSYLTIQETNLFYYKENIERKLVRLKAEMDKHITNLTFEMEHYKQILESIDQKGYHAHVELENVKDYLIERGIDVILGVEWITRLRLTERQKRQMIRKNPMISFSIIVESNQIPKIKRTLKGYKKELTIPILLMDKTHTQEDEKEFLYELHRSLFVFHHFQIRYHSDDWQALQREIRQSIEKYEGDLRNKKRQLKELEQLENELYTFWSNYSSVSRKELANQINRIKQAITVLHEEESELDLTIRLSEEKRKSIASQIKEKQKEIDHIRQVTNEFASFNYRYLNLNTNKSKLEVTNQDFAELKRTVEFIKITIKKLESKKDSHTSNINKYKLVQSNLLRDFKDYDFLNVEEKIVATEQEYSKQKSIYKSLREKANSDFKRLESLERILNQSENTMQRYEQDIESLGYSMETIGSMNMVYDQRLLEQFKFEVNGVYDIVKDWQEKLQKAKIDQQTSKHLYDKEVMQIDKFYEKEPYEFGETVKEEIELIEQQKDRLANRIKSEKTTEEDIKKKLLNLTTALDGLDGDKQNIVGIVGAEVLRDEEWNEKNPSRFIFDQNSKITDKRGRLSEQRFNVSKRLDQLLEDIKKTGNGSLIHMTKQLIELLDQDKDDYDLIIKSFLDIIEKVKIYEKVIEVEKKQSEEGRESLIDNMYARSETIHKNIIDITKSSQIKRGADIVHLIKIRWTRREPEEAKNEYRLFVDNVLKELSKQKYNGLDDAQLDVLFDKMMTMKNVINCYADINRCVVKVVKPENFLLNKYDDHFWDEVADWSGGEKQSARMCMFIAFNNHLRKRRFSKETSTKFIIVDNPFGEASSDHVVKPYIDLAKMTNTQLFCLTGIKDKSIQAEFDTVISNQYIFRRGILMLSSQERFKNEDIQANVELDSIFYAK